MWFSSAIGSAYMRTQRAIVTISILSHNLELQYSVPTQRDHCPDSPNKENYDSFCIGTQIQGNPSLMGMVYMVQSIQILLRIG